jgi:hypothetical protein
MIVQDLFRDCDSIVVAEKLLEYFGEDTKLKYMDDLDRYYKMIDMTILDILDLKPILQEDYIFVSMVYDVEPKSFDPYLSPSIIKLEDLRRHKDSIIKLSKHFDVQECKDNYVTSYGLMFCNRKELLGYKFCENILSKYDKDDVIASVLYELTWFGYSNEDYARNLDKETNELLESEKEIEEGKGIPFEEAMEEIFGEDWKDELEDIPQPTKEDIDENIKRNTIPEYEEFLWIIKKENL